jgi:hypothetical protein
MLSGTRKRERLRVRWIEGIQDAVAERIGRRTAWIEKNGD